MEVRVHSLYHSSLRYFEGKVEVVGNLKLLHKVNALKKAFGSHPKNWQIENSQNSPEDILLNEFINKINDKKTIRYSHDELCHCRLVPTEKVKNAVIEGCLTVPEVSRVTLAGTGCGTCKKDIQTTIEDLSVKPSI